MPPETLITIGVLNRNGAHRLRRTIPSLRKQDYQPREILVLDNGSEDESVAYLKQFQDVRVIEAGRNLGYGAGKNELVRQANGRYVLLLDNDIDLPEETFLTRLLAEYQALPNPAFLSPLLRDVDKECIDTGGLYFNRINKSIPLKDILGTGIHRVPRYRGGICLFRKEIFEELGRFDEIYPFSLDDYDMSARAYLRGYSNYRTTNLLAIHHGLDTRTDAKAVAWKYRYSLCGFSRMIWKNYRPCNVLKWWPVAIAWILVKSIRESLKYKSVRPLGACLSSFCRFLRDFGDTWRQRRRIQAQRVVADDKFLDVAFFERSKQDNTTAG